MRTAKVGESIDRPLETAGPMVVLAPANRPSFCVRHIFPRFANRMDFVIPGAQLDRSWRQDGPCHAALDFGHLTNTKLACSALHYFTATAAVMLLLSTYMF
jgi:hypothetical protein